SSASHSPVAPFVHAAQQPSGTPLSPTPVNAGFVESPLGVAAPAPLAATPSGSQGSAVAANQTHVAPVPVTTPQAHAVGAPIANGATLHAVPNAQLVTTLVGTSGFHTMASMPVWASYVGRPGTQILGIALNPSPGAAQPIVVTGLTQDSNDPTEVDLLV